MQASACSALAKPSQHHPLQSSALRIPVGHRSMSISVGVAWLLSLCVLHQASHVILVQISANLSTTNAQLQRCRELLLALRGDL